MTVKVGSTLFEVREGPWVSDKAPWNPAGAKQMYGGKVRLTLTRATDGSWRSVGLSGPVLEPGKVYSLTFERRIDQMDPAAVFAIWGHNDLNQDEVDMLEATRWGDQNNPSLYHGGWFDKGNRVEEPTMFPGRAFAKHRVTITTSGGQVKTVIEGWWATNGVWKEVARFTAPWMDGMIFRIAMWLYTRGPFYTDATDRGPLSVDVSAFSVVALASTDPR